MPRRARPLDVASQPYLVARHGCLVQVPLLPGFSRPVPLSRYLEIEESMRYVWLVIAFLVAIVSVFAGRVLGFSAVVTVGLTAITTSLAIFPFARRWMPRTSFTACAIGTVIGAGVSWLLYLGFSRLGL